jgi:hypothetical protein
MLATSEDYTSQFSQNFTDSTFQNFLGKHKPGNRFPIQDDLLFHPTKPSFCCYLPQLYDLQLLLDRPSLVASCQIPDVL